MSTQQEKEWLTGPHIRLASNETRTIVWHIPLGYRCRGYREVSGSVVQRAIYTVGYVEAGFREDLDNLQNFYDERELSAKLMADFAAGVVNVDTLGVGGGQSGRDTSTHEVQNAMVSHAALVIYSSTKKNRIFGTKSKLDVILEICVEPIHAGQSSSPAAQSSKVPSKERCMELQAEANCLRQELDDVNRRLAEAERKLALEQDEGTE